jgi:hypothetical protein
MLPQAFAKATPLLTELRLWAASAYPGRTLSNWEQLRRSVESFSTTLTDELDKTLNYALTDKGALSIHALVDGVSKVYPPDIMTFLAASPLLQQEIDAGGNCLAFTMYSASGFHILRAVELTIMAYVLAATGKLPNPSNRSWSTYINILKESGAHQDVLDVLTVLKTKRNPVMHPEETLDLHNAINLLCLSEATICALIEDANRRSLNEKLIDAVRALPEQVKKERVAP